MRSPFKFLNAFTRNDHAAFFAREEEVQRLYEMISKNRLIMIYGPSGSGKTSLVQCGLSARFDVTDWYPLFIRRKEDINLSLQYALIQALDGRGGADIAESVEDIYATYLRPAFLIFDQLEELLILGSEEEQQQFFRSMAALLQAELPCRIIFIFREDYLAHLYRFERIIPSLFNRRLRVEQMNRTQIEEVITRSCALFNMKLQPEEEVITQITDRLLAGNQSLGLPYLQVYLDRLYRTVFQKTYQRERKGEELPLLEISQDEIEALGVIDEVMEQFLLEQQKSVQSTLERSYTALPDDFTADVLDRFVSFEGTKQPVPFYEKVDGIAFGLDLFDSLLRQFPKAALVSCLELLERSRVLVKKDNVLEIAHDSLALLINDNRTTQQKQLNRVRQRISNAYQEFLISHSLLGKAPLRTIEPFLEQLEPELESGPLAFVRDSIAAVEQAERQELEQERKKRVRNRNLAIIGFTLLAVTTVASLVAFVQWKRVEQDKREV
ncbi:MAG: ATP-binding protein, partial [Lewinella sp.]|nr:ATP-binding protein [Lewinella sp.]